MKHFCIILFLVGLVGALSMAPGASHAIEGRRIVNNHPLNLAVDQCSLSEDTEQHGEPTVNDVEQAEDESSAGNSDKIGLLRSVKYFLQPVWLPVYTHQSGGSSLSLGRPTYIVIRTLRI